ncbi:MAG TPA: LLM class flavin-dependent oxidoreductase [Solirubrobacteraceae bacterium]|jgi:5,10-methylenetetrahydromethanopterin reductase
MSISISIGISPRESLRDWMRFCGEAEQDGVSEMWLIDSQLAMKDVYAGLALAALGTERMTLGTGVTNLHTRHPTVTANAIAAISELSGGRAALGLGAGDSAVYGLGRKPSKVAEVREALRFFAEALNGRTGTWEGREYELAQSAPATPVHLAVSQPRMCRLAGELADGAIVMGPAQPDLLARQLGWIEEGLARGGRDRSQITVGFITTLSMSDDPERALRDVRSWASAQARLQADAVDLPASLEPFAEELARAKADYDYGEHLSTRAGHQGTVSDELVRTLAVAGSPEECRTRVRGLLDTGVDTLIFPLMGTGRLERLSSIREHILPAIEKGAQHGPRAR